jgi:universal stress protein A
MTEWKKILCAIDFSELSRIAMLHATERAKATGAELTLVNVIPRAHASMIAEDLLAPTQAEVTEELMEEMDRKMAPWREEAARLCGSPVRTRILVGDAADRITRFAENDRTDLIVIGTHGRTGVKRAVLGSVAEKVVREAPCSVLVTRRPPGTA